jgi:pimeloyl-ACP methyl ester carboxylesterase
VSIDASVQSLHILRCALQVSPAGHCPQAEAPDLVAQCLRAWIQHTSDGAEPLLQVCVV